MASVQASTSNILVLGSAHGKLKALFAKIASINSKNGPFTFAILLGDLFSDSADESEIEDLLAGSVDVPLECFCMMGGKSLPAKVISRVQQQNGEVCRNLIFLGKQGIYTTATGLRLATFGASFDLDSFTSAEDSENTLEKPHFTASSLAAFLNALSAPPKKVPGAKAMPVDILLTHSWPSGISQYSTKPPDHADAATFGVPAIADIVAVARPRYHFASGHAVFYEREPFVWPETTDVTRFFGLGDFANTQKERWFYAFSISLPASAAVPTNATACPIHPGRGIKRSAEETASETTNFRFEDGGARKKGKTVPPDSYVCRKCDLPGHWVQDCNAGGGGDERQNGRGRGRGKKERKPKHEITPSECYFCLSNPKVTKHLIVAIGSEAYVTLPVGQVPDTSAQNTPVPGGGHLLIVPIAHFPTLHSLPVDQSEGILSEMEKFKAAIRECYASFGCKAVCYEVGRLSARGGHAHVQICPVPEAVSSSAEAVFLEEGKREGVDFEADAESALEDRPDNYFRADLPSGKKLIHIIRAGFEHQFNLQFGRVVLAHLLDAPDRIDWRTCALPAEEETKDAQAFKKAFAKFDPS